MKKRKNETEMVTISIDRYEALMEAAVDLGNINNAIINLKYDGERVKAIKSILGIEVEYD